VDEQGALGVNGRAISRRVLAEMSAAWEEPWRSALRFQHRNPDVLAIAARAPKDFADAARTMVPLFALIHPDVLRTAIIHCQAVVAEFGFEGDPDIPVSPRRDDPEVLHLAADAEPDVCEGCAELTQRVEALERIIAGAGAVLASPPDPAPSSSGDDRLEVLEATVTGAGAVLRALRG
jgi:hypothetical protein